MKIEKLRYKEREILENLSYSYTTVLNSGDLRDRVSVWCHCPLTSTVITTASHFTCCLRTNSGITWHESSCHCAGRKGSSSPQNAWPSRHFIWKAVLQFPYLQSHTLHFEEKSRDRYVKSIYTRLGYVFEKASLYFICNSQKTLKVMVIQWGELWIHRLDAINEHDV